MELGHRALVLSVVGLAACGPQLAAPAATVPAAASSLQPANAPQAGAGEAEPPPLASGTDSGKAWARPKRALELEIGYRLTDEGEVGNATSFQIQPMLFWNRRILLGTRFGIDPIVGEDAFDSYELDLYLGYQHFLGKSTVPYLRAIVGAASIPPAEGEEDDQSVINYGGEIGVKLYTSRSFYGVLAGGSTRTAPIYGSLGFGFGFRMGHGGGDSFKAAIFIPIVVGLAAALVPWGIDRATR